MPAPLPPQEVLRLDVLRGYEVLDTPAEAAFERLTALAARLLGMPIALITLVDEDRLWLKSTRGLEVGETSRARAFCGHTILQDEPLVVPDATQDPRFADSPLVTGRAGVRFYAGAPLRTADGHRLGSLCVMDLAPRELEADGRELLRDLAAIAMDELDLRQELRRRQRAEGDLARDHERLRLLESVAVNTNDAVLITEAVTVDEPGPRIIYANQAFERMSGYTEAEVLGRTPRLLQGVNTDPAARAAIRRALKRWRPVRVELINYHKDGTEFWVDLSITPVANEQGWFTHWISVQRDVTGRRATEAAARAKEAAEQANAAKSEFLSRMSHELRTPLNAILGFGQLLEMETSSGTQLESVQQILGGGRHLLQLVNEVLDLAGVESGRVEMLAEAVDVAEVAQETLALVQPLATRRGIGLDLRVPPFDAPPAHGARVLADRQRLKQVLLNLLSNAIKYNVPGGRVTLDYVLRGERLRLRVADTGPGVPTEKRARLFTPFDRLGAELSGVEGTGLGLTLSKRLMEAMGGSLGIEEDLAPVAAVAADMNPGAVFWLELPMAPRPLRAVTVAAVDLPLWPPTGVEELPPDVRTVLLIEDNLSNVRLIERLMEAFPTVRLLCAMQGGLGLDLARQHRPDLILLDLQLPDLSGVEVLERLRAEAPTRDTPVVVISADAIGSQVERLMQAGAYAYLTKPLDIREFVKIMRETLLVGALMSPPHASSPR